MEYFRQRIPVFDEIAQILPAVGWAILIENLAFQALCVPVMLLSILLARALPCLMTLKIIVSMCLILPINFRYLSDEEQARIVGYFAEYLKIAPDTLQILCVTREPDVTAYIRRMQEMRDKEPSKACRDMIDDNIRTVHQYTSGGALTTRFFLAFRFEPATMALHGEGFAAVADALYDAEETARQYLSRCGLSVVQPDYANNFVVETVYSLLCKQTSRTEKLLLYFRAMLAAVHGGERSGE